MRSRRRPTWCRHRRAISRPVRPFGTASEVPGCDHGSKCVNNTARCWTIPAVRRNEAACRPGVAPKAIVGAFNIQRAAGGRPAHRGGPDILDAAQDSLHYEFHPRSEAQQIALTDCAARKASLAGKLSRKGPPRVSQPGPRAPTCLAQALMPFTPRDERAETP